MSPSYMLKFYDPKTDKWALVGGLFDSVEAAEAYAREHFPDKPKEIDPIPEEAA